MPKAARKRAKSASKTRSEDTPSGLSREEIAKRAYEIHLRRGGTHGHDLDDWLQAEIELREAAESPKRQSDRLADDSPGRRD